MDKLTFANIEKSISPERLATYKTDGATNEVALARYIYNIELSKSFYPIINIFEVTLRNSIDNALKKFFDVQDWSDVIPLTETERRMVDEAKTKIIQRDQIPIAPAPSGVEIAAMVSSDYPEGKL